MAEPVHEGVVRTPAAPLRPFVERYRGYRMEGDPPALHHGLPSRHLPFMLSFDRPVVSRGEDGMTSRWAFAGGLHDRAATIVHDGNQHGMAIQMTPMGARVLFGLPAGALSGTVVELDEVLGAYARELYDRTAAATSWDDRFAIVDDVLMRAARRRLEDPPEPPSEVVRAWRRLVATGGGVEIGALADEVGWSRRHLSEKFRAEVGLSPKVAARLRAGPPPAVDADAAGVGGRRRRLRLLRPGPLHPRMDRALRVHADPLDRRRAPIHARRRIAPRRRMPL